MAGHSFAILYEVYENMFEFLKKHITVERLSNLKAEDEFLLALRLNLMVEDLVYRFCVAKSTVRSIFHKWLCLSN